jgi:hypothetical protein
MSQGPSLLQSFVLLCLHLSILLEPDRLYLDESASLERLKRTNLIHLALACIVQLLSLRASAQDDAVALVQPQSHLSVDRLLALLDIGFEKFALGAESPLYRILE